MVPEEEYSRLFVDLLAPLEKVTHSDGEGRYELDVQWSSKFHIIAVKAGVGAACALANAGERIDLVLEGEGCLSVFVTNDKGYPVQDATVIYVPSCRFAGRWQQLTDPSGKATLKGIPVGSGRITVLHASYCRVDEEIQELHPCQDDSIEIILTSGGTVIGDVTCADSGSALSGVLVSLHDSDSKFAFTDQSGSYTLSGVPVQGFWGIHFQIEGYAKETAYVCFENASRERKLDIQLARGRTAHGHVRNDGESLGGARVLALGYYGDAQAGAVGVDNKVTTTGRDGLFSLSDLRLDVRYVVTVLHPEFSRSSIEVPPSDDIDVDLGEIELKRPAWIHGVVLDSAGNTLSGVDVSLIVDAFPKAKVTKGRNPLDNIGGFVESAFQRLVVRTRIDGSFLFTGLTRCEFEIETYCPGFVSTRRRVEAGENPEYLEISLARGAVLSGYVLDGALNRRSTAFVTLKWLPGEQEARDVSFREAKVSASPGGAFRFQDLPAGLFLLSARCSDCEPYEAEVRVLADPVKGGNLERDLVLLSRAEASDWLPVWHPDNPVEEAWVRPRRSILCMTQRGHIRHLGRCGVPPVFHRTRDTVTSPQCNLFIGRDRPLSKKQDRHCDSN